MEIRRIYLINVVSFHEAIKPKYSANFLPSAIYAT
jgi:hypothetical protein